MRSPPTLGCERPHLAQRLDEPHSTALDTSARAPLAHLDTIPRSALATCVPPAWMAVRIASHTDARERCARTDETRTHRVHIAAGHGGHMQARLLTLACTSLAPVIASPSSEARIPCRITRTHDRTRSCTRRPHHRAAAVHAPITAPPRPSADWTHRASCAIHMRSVRIPRTRPVAPRALARGADPR